MPKPDESRNIVLLSDGTGNSSAKLMKTNVWRMYEAIKLTAGDQLALYDNGVGTSSFKPFAVLGGALGWGLKRNVRTLYMFACSNYRPGDRIFAFGFSRGAFTIRVLIGLIDDQGLITGVKGRELERRAKWAYRAYRKRFNPTKGLVTPLRAIRDWVLRKVERGPRYTGDGNVKPSVAFVGLWDTVDAYGLPIDEMTRGWDQWVWPLSMSDRRAPDVAEKICHAVALDDERHTFHPVLLDETGERRSAHTDEERVTQVWFAGVHSNVGGGYPDDSLAHVSLRWMASEACKKRLRLHEHVTNEWEARADPNGPLFDSRRGLGCYYRYNPRSIKKLTDDRFAKVAVPRPKVHHTVFGRIAAGRDDYAPIVLPDQYVVVREDGALLEGDHNPYEHPTQARSRCADQERVWNLVWWRRIAYFTTVGLTALLLARPFIIDPNAGGLLAVPSNGLSGAIGLLSTFLPRVAEPWVEFYQHRPIQLIVLGGLIGGLLWVSTSLQRAISDSMRGIWDATTRQPASPVTPSRPPTDWVYRFRSHRLYRDAFGAVTRKILPFVFGFGCLAALMVAVAGTANRMWFAARSAAGVTCVNASTLRPWHGEPIALPLRSNELCQQTGLELKQGHLYRVEIVLPDNDVVPWDEQWRDKEIPVATSEGFSSGRSPLFMMFLPFRRVLTARWFVPMVRIGNHLAEYHQLNRIEEIPRQLPAGQPPQAGVKRKSRGFVEFTPTFTGQMFLFVNDAVLPGPWVKRLYENNHGTATVTVSEIESDAVREGFKFAGGPLAAGG
jgi:uncharacterized protein (DUF2235 family)